MEDVWFMDCYCHGAMLGKEFPVNSYSSKNLKTIYNTIDVLFTTNVYSGIDEVRISRNTKGQCPVSLD